MKIYNNLQLVEQPLGSFVFFDTNSLIAAINHLVDFQPILDDFVAKKFSFVTIPAVAFEFSRTDSIKGYNERVGFLKKYVSVYPIEKFMDKIQDIIPVMQKIHGTLSYPDFLLYCCLYRFPHSYLLTENHKDFLTSILDRTGILTIEEYSKEIRNIALYSFNYEKYNKAAAHILSAADKNPNN
jgi:hypothetical protein